MLNRYPAWKNALILLVVLLGFLYSVPNIYPDDEAIQVSADGVTLSDSDMANITTALEAAQVEFFGEEVSDENILTNRTAFSNYCTRTNMRKMPDGRAVTNDCSLINDCGWMNF